MISGTRLVILGFGGHARSVAAVALANGIRSLLFVDENARENETFLDFPVIRQLTETISEGWSCIPAIGDNARRQKQLQFAQAAGLSLAKVVARSATIDVDARIAAGCFVGHHAHIGPQARIGSGTIINTGAIVEHESEVGEFSHVSVNAVVAGRSKLGDFVFLGAGATVINNISIGNNITIGAGSVVVSTLGLSGAYAGCPARLIS